MEFVFTQEVTSSSYGKKYKIWAFSVKWVKIKNAITGLVKHGKNVVGVNFGHFQINLNSNFYQHFMMQLSYFGGTKVFIIQQRYYQVCYRILMKTISDLQGRKEKRGFATTQDGILSGHMSSLDQIHEFSPSISFFLSSIVGVPFLEKNDSLL